MWHSHKNEPHCTVESLNGYVQLLKLKKNMRDYIIYMYIICIYNLYVKMEILADNNR